MSSVAFRDYYETLGVPRDASDEEIRRAHRRLARRYHPDVNKEPGAEDRFKEVSEAYDVLRDPEKRRRYDRFGQNWRAGENVDPSDFRDFDFGRGGFGGGRGAGPADARFDFGGGLEGADVSDFFEQLFGRGAARAGGRARGQGRATGFDGFAMRGADHEATLELSLEEAARGGRRAISLGDGRDYDVTIPAGVRDGQRIRLAGQGGPGDPPGDLLLRVRIRPHPRFRLDGRDVVVELPVAPWEAALGTTAQVPTLHGRARLRVPPGSSSGRRLRLRGEGMPDPRGAPGDLYAVVKIVVPRRPTREERELFERLAEVSRFDPRSGS